MTTRSLPNLHTYCREGDPNCLRAWLHSGDCKPGCRICHTTDHTTPNCPSWTPYVLTGKTTTGDGFLIPPVPTPAPPIPPADTDD